MQQNAIHSIFVYVYIYKRWLLEEVLSSPDGLHTSCYLYANFQQICAKGYCHVALESKIFSCMMQNVKLFGVYKNPSNFGSILFFFCLSSHLSSLHSQLITMVSIARISSYLTNQISMNEAASMSGPFTLSVKDINTSGGQWYVVTFNSFLTHLIKTISYSSWCGKYGHQRTICPYLR